MRAFAIVGCGIIALLAASAPAVGASEITVHGTYSASAAGPGGTWAAVVVAATGHLHGAMTYDDGSIVDLDGTITAGTIQIPIVAPGGVAGHFSGQVSGTTLGGTYNVGGAEGTWAGVADAALPTN
jgi:hypothetical protein